ncbi:uncharacterized protein LOC143281572 [Babylonia areolata]|uniref:uncharacterized protein LOC143281572 n=1 Tax=Babylonia areolata TaxID=304850 RepID=UPI003FCEFD3B
MKSHGHHQDQDQHCIGNYVMFSPTKANHPDARSARPRNGQDYDRQLDKNKIFNVLGIRNTGSELNYGSHGSPSCTPGSSSNDDVFRTHKSVNGSFQGDSDIQSSRNRHCCMIRPSDHEKDRCPVQRDISSYKHNCDTVRSANDHRRRTWISDNYHKRDCQRQNYEDSYRIAYHHSSSYYHDRSQSRFQHYHRKDNSYHSPVSESLADRKRPRSNWTDRQREKARSHTSSRRDRLRERSRSHTRSRTDRRRERSRSHTSSRRDRRRKRSRSGTCKRQDFEQSQKRLRMHGGSKDSFISDSTVPHPSSGSQKLHDRPVKQFLTTSPATKRPASKFSCKSSSLSCHHSVSRLLLNSHERGKVGDSRLYKTLVLSTASSLSRTDSRSVFPSEEYCEHLDHMTHMVANKGNDQLVCMWSVSGTALQQIQVMTVKHRAKRQCGELALEISLTSSVVRTWGEITSLCWADCSGTSYENGILYTSKMRSSSCRSVACICSMDTLSDGRQHVDFVLGESNVWTCTWNACKPQFGVGLERGCKVVDVNTGQFWELDTHRDKVLSQAFSKVDGGNLLFCGIRNGAVLMHDVRRETRRPIMLMTHGHRKSVCDLKLSPDEHHIYTSDNHGQIKKWDLRTCKTEMNYEGLCNNWRHLPFHIDDSQSVLYAAGTDCYTKVWCLESGQLLNSIPPPYPACPLRVPAVQFSSMWAGVPGNIGLIMGGQKDLHLYSSGL